MVVGLRPGSASRAEAEGEGLTVLDVGEAASRGDVVMILLPDEKQAEVWESEIRDGIAPGNLLMFAHGFSIHFGQIEPPPGVDVGMVAPKGPGHLVRRQFTEGRGVPCLMAVHQDATGNRPRPGPRLREAASAAAGRGHRDDVQGRVRDRPVRRAGGAVRRRHGARPRRLRDAGRGGYDPRLAYFECLHELKLIVDLMYEKGIQGMRDSISNTAEYGDMTRGKRVIAEETREAMRKILADIQSGEFAQGVDRREPRRRRELPAHARRGRRPPGRAGRQGASLDDALDRRRAGVLAGRACDDAPASVTEAKGDDRDAEARPARLRPRPARPPESHRRRRPLHRRRRRCGPAADYPVHLDIEHQEEYSRFMPLIKWLLAIPHYIVLLVLGIGALFVDHHLVLRGALHGPLPARDVRLHGGRPPLGVQGRRVLLT